MTDSQSKQPNSTSPTGKNPPDPGSLRSHPPHHVSSPLNELLASIEQKQNLIGQTLDHRYRLNCKIGEGGMAVVYEATDLLIHKRVAVKVLHLSMAQDPEQVKRFEQEALQAARFQSEHLVDITGLGHTREGIVYLVMEYLQGESLSTFLRSHPGPMPWRRAVRLTMQLCDVLDLIHRHGVIHRDIKPANCFLTRDRNGKDLIKLLDLGLVKVDPDFRDSISSPKTRAGILQGTPEYFAPERIDDGGYDHRIDIYALGVMLYRMLSGELPFKGQSAFETILQHAKEVAPPLRKVAPKAKIPEKLEAITMRCMAKDPKQRFSSALEVKKALQEVVGLETQAALRAQQSGHSIALPQATLPQDLSVPGLFRLPYRFAIRSLVFTVMLTAMVASAIAFVAILMLFDEHWQPTDTSTSIVNQEALHVEDNNSKKNQDGAEKQVNKPENAIKVEPIIPLPGDVATHQDVNTHPNVAAHHVDTVPMEPSQGQDEQDGQEKTGISNSAANGSPPEVEPEQAPESAQKPDMLADKPDEPQKKPKAPPKPPEQETKKAVKSDTSIVAAALNKKKSSIRKACKQFKTEISATSTDVQIRVSVELSTGSIQDVRVLGRHRDSPLGLCIQNQVRNSKVGKLQGPKNSFDHTYRL